MRGAAQHPVVEGPGPAEEGQWNFSTAWRPGRHAPEKFIEFYAQKWAFYVLCSLFT